MTSLPSTDSLDSLVLHDTTHSPTKNAGQGSSVVSPDLEEALIAAAEAILTSQACYNFPCKFSTVYLVDACHCCCSMTLRQERACLVRASTSASDDTCAACKFSAAGIHQHLYMMQVVSKSPAGVRAKLVAREIDILQRELDTKAVVYVMGRAHMHMRSQAKSAFEWYATVSPLLFGFKTVSIHDSP